MKNSFKFASFIAAIGCSVLSVSAADRYWDGTDTTADADGGAGTWNIVLTNWDTAATAGTDTAFTALDNAFFGGAAGTVTTGAAFNAGTVTFNTAGYTINTNGNAMTWGSLAGSSGFTKSGAGILTINGSGGSSGAISLTGGQITVGGVSALGTTTVSADGASTILAANGNNITNAVTLTNGAKLNTTNGSTISSAITLGTGGGLISGGTGNYGIFTGKITGGTAGTTSLTINSGHTQLNNTTNDFLGNVSISNYYLKPVVSEVIPDTAEITISTGGGLKFQPAAAGSYTETIAALNGGGYQTWAEGTGVNCNLRVGSGGANSNYTSAITQFGGAVLSLTKIGTGTMTLSGAGGYTGGTTLSAGTIIANNGNALGTGGTVTINDASTGSNNTSLLLGNVTMGRAVTIANQGSGTTTLGSNGAVALPTFSGAITLAKNVTFDGSTNTDRLTFTGGIGGTGNITIAGTGRVAFNTTANTFTGDVTVNSGALLQLGDVDDTVNLIPDSSIVTNNGMMKLTKGNLRSETIAGLTGSGTVRSHEAVGSTASTLIIDMASGSQTFSGILEDGGATGSTLSLTKSGAGTQTLSGANTYTGATNVNGGTLALTGTATLSGSSITVASGAFFDVSGLTGGFTLGGGKTLKGEGTVTGNVSTDVTGVPVITAGNGTSGTLAINGDLTITAVADLNVGTLSNYTSTAAVAVTGNLAANGNPGDVLVNLPTAALAAGTYKLISSANTLPDASVFTLGTQPALGSRQAGSLVANPNSLDYVVTGINPVWTGAQSSEWSTATITPLKNWVTNVATDYIEGDAVTFNDSATGTTTVNLAMDVYPASVNFDHSAKDYTLQSTGGFAIAVGTLNKSGTGILTINNANTFIGDATLTAGTIRVGNGAALGTGNLVLNGGTLSSDSTTARALANTAASIGGDVTLGDATNNGVITLAGNVDLTTGTRVLTTASDATLAGSITNGSLTKAGSGTLTLTGTNSYGATTINAGTLRIGAGGTTGSAGTGTITNNAALVVDHNGTPSIGGAINGTGSLTVTGGGTLTLTGSNGYTGTTTINGSTLVLGMAPTYSVSHVGSAVTINAGGTLQLTQPHATGFAYSFANAQAANVTINPGGTFDRNGNDTYVQNLTMTGNSVVTGAAGLRLCANLTATSDAFGAPIINSIGLVGGSYTNAGNTHTLTVIHGVGSTETSDLTLGPIDQVTQAGATNLIKDGNGTLTLSIGASSYTGTTTVNAGTLDLNGSLVSAMTVKNTATLKGSGTSTGTLSVESGGTVAPGNSIGTLGVGATTLAGTYVCEVDATTSDVLAVTGNLDLTGSTFTLSGTPAAASYTIATYTGTLTGTFTATLSGYSLDYSTVGQIKLVSTAGYSSWAATNAPGQTLDQDHDGDGVSNGVEYFMGLSGNSFTANPAPNASNVISWPKGGSYTGTYGTDFVVQISTDLAAWTDVAPADVNDTSGSVEYDLDTLPTGVKKFARLKVTGP